MRPLHLSLQAFGPFSGSERIDFTRLGRYPLFLINGPTGAGKSSVLDAICFALYGATTSSERDPGQMRCDFSAPNLLTEIVLEFALANKRYRIRRVPTQERPKARGEGITVHDSQAQLWEHDGLDFTTLLVAKKVNEANKYIIDLIGLTLEQFRQVIILPQGKFRDLLLADSRDREKIFGQLFQTGIYKRIEEQLRLRSADIIAAVNNHKKVIEGILSSVEVDSIEALDMSLNDLHVERSQKELSRDVALKHKNRFEANYREAVQLGELFDQLSNKRNQLLGLQERSAAFNDKKSQLNLAEKANLLQPLFVRNSNDERTVKELKTSVFQSELETKKLDKEKLQTERALNAATLAYDDIVKLQVRHQELEKAQININKFSALTTSVNALKKQVSDNDADHLVIKRKLKSCIDYHEKLNVEQQQLLDQIAGETDLQLQLQSLQQAVKQWQVLEKHQVNLVELNCSLEIASKSLKQAEVEFKKAQDNTIRAEILWHNGQAALLALRLEEQQPCPVCGSLDHPDPAAYIEDSMDAIVSKQDIDQLKEIEVEKRTLLESAKADCNNNTISVQHTQKNIENLQKDLGDYADTSLSDICLQLKSIESQISKIINIKQLRQKCVSETSKLAEQIQSQRGLLENHLEKSNAVKEQLIQEQESLRNVSSVIDKGWLEEGALEREILLVSKCIEDTEQNYQNALHANKKTRSHWDQAYSRHKTIEAQLNDQLSVLNRSSSAWQSALQISVFDNLDDFLNCRLDQQEIDDLRNQIDQYNSQATAISGSITQLQESIKDRPYPNIDECAATLKTATEAFDEIDQQFRNIDERCRLLFNIKDKINLANEKNRQLDEDYKVIGTLSDVANGKNSINISLQRFVLSVLLDDVLIQASERLRLMSKGRYRLLRKQEKGKGNKASGLELLVEDSYTGKTRSVATLSGGESFIAALSLALGLSDVVQTHAGGIKLDTLFIDEGFGSLDSESLDLAVKTLIDLQASGRMIGVISHVAELKEQMMQRIDITSDRGGSYISTISV